MRYNGGYVLAHGRGTIGMTVEAGHGEDADLHMFLYWGEGNTVQSKGTAGEGQFQVTITNMALFYSDEGFNRSDLVLAMGWATRTLRDRRLRFGATVLHLDAPTRRIAMEEDLDFVVLMELDR